jgi:hypothetical protein
LGLCVRDYFGHFGAFKRDSFRNVSADPGRLRPERPLAFRSRKISAAWVAAPDSWRVFVTLDVVLPVLAPFVQVDDYLELMKRCALDYAGLLLADVS